MLALFDAHFGAGQSEQGMLHHDHATDYLVLVEQKVVPLARDVLPGSEDLSGRDGGSPRDSAPPTDGKPSDGKPSDGKPSDGKLTDRKPADRKPADSKPRNSKPRDGAPRDSAPPRDGTPRDSAPPRDGVPTDGASPRDRAQFVAAVCRGLFGDAEIDERRLLRMLPEDASQDACLRMHGICEQARSLRAKVAHGRPQRWEFGDVPGAPVDAERQELWPGSDPGGVVEFVVVPAYMVDTDTLLRRQRVFTVAVRPASSG